VKLGSLSGFYWMANAETKRITSTAMLCKSLDLATYRLDLDEKQREWLMCNKPDKENKNYAFILKHRKNGRKLAKPKNETQTNLF
jgi:hypothetical protein